MHKKSKYKSTTLRLTLFGLIHIKEKNEIYILYIIIHTFFFVFIYSYIHNNYYFPMEGPQPWSTATLEPTSASIFSSLREVNANSTALMEPVHLRRQFTNSHPADE